MAMDEETNALMKVISKSSNIAAKLFRTSVEKLSFADAARVSAGLQVIGKFIDERRSELADRLERDILDGNTDGVAIEETDSGNPKALVPDLNLYTSKRGGGRKIDQSKVEELVADNEKMDAERIFEFSDEYLDLKALRNRLQDAGTSLEEVAEELAEEYDFEREDIFKRDIEGVDEDILNTLVMMNELEEDDLEECYDEVPVRWQTRCTFNKDTKSALLTSLEEGVEKIDTEDDDEAA